MTIKFFLKHFLVKFQSQSLQKLYVVPDSRAKVQQKGNWEVTRLYLTEIRMCQIQAMLSLSSILSDGNNEALLTSLHMYTQI